MKRTIGFVTSHDLRSLIESERDFTAYAAKRDLIIKPVVWNDKEQDLSAFDFLIIRTPWDYFLKFSEFSGWLNYIESEKIKIYNPLDIIRWNIHKFYLKELEEKGVSIIPTVFINQNSSDNNLYEIMKSNGWNKAVIKPAVSGGAYKTYLVNNIDEALALQKTFDDILFSCDALVQKYSEEINSKGEWSLIFFNNKYSHSALKVPLENDFRVQHEFGGTYLYEEAPPYLIQQAGELLKKVNPKLLYARVDGVDADGTLQLMELELIEPDLFLNSELSMNNFLNVLLPL